MCRRSWRPTRTPSSDLMEKSGALLTRVTKVFFGVAQANLNDTLEKIRDDVSPKLAAHQDAIFRSDGEVRSAPHACHQGLLRGRAGEPERHPREDPGRCVAEAGGPPGRHLPI